MTWLKRNNSYIVLAQQVNLKCYSTGERRRLYKESGEKYGEFSQRSTGK